MGDATGGKSSVLDRLRRPVWRDQKNMVKDRGCVVRSGMLWKYKQKEGKWKKRPVEVFGGGYLLWWPSEAKGTEKTDYKGFIDLKNARLTDESDVTGVDASGRSLQKGNAVIYDLKDGKSLKRGTMKEQSLQKRMYSWSVRINSTGGDPEEVHTFAADGDHEKEEWWK
eukprot:Sspe_Gene.114415::Locus_99965_Transcript_1_1_Confidence_1.000_Length_568::g.114415::m.114415